MSNTTSKPTSFHRDDPPDAILIAETDNVAVCLKDIDKGADASIMAGKDTLTVTATDAVPRGHKIAIRDIAAAEKIIKYGEVIGQATQDIGKGNHVHRHNVVD